MLFHTVEILITGARGETIAAHRRNNISRASALCSANTPSWRGGTPSAGAGRNQLCLLPLTCRKRGRCTGCDSPGQVGRSMLWSLDLSGPEILGVIVWMSCSSSSSCRIAWRSRGCDLRKACCYYETVTSSFHCHHHCCHCPLLSDGGHFDNDGHSYGFDHDDDL